MTPTPAAESRTISVDDEVYAELVKIKREIEIDTGERATFNDAVWRVIGLQKKQDAYADKPRLRSFFERGYHARVMGAPRTYPGQVTGFFSRNLKRVWLEGYDLADDRAKGHLVEEVKA